MAKVPFTKLKCKINEDSVPVQIGEETIGVKQYLPIQEKLGLIGRVVELAHEEDFNYSNPVKADVFLNLEIIFAYTNIAFTDKQKEDLPKLYDMLSGSKILDTVLINIPEDELIILRQGVQDSIESIYKYQNSILGILDTIGADYSNLDFNITDLQQKLADPNNLELVRGMLTKIN